MTAKPMTAISALEERILMSIKRNIYTKTIAQWAAGSPLAENRGCQMKTITTFKTGGVFCIPNLGIIWNILFLCTSNLYGVGMWTHQVSSYQLIKAH